MLYLAAELALAALVLLIATVVVTWPLSRTFSTMVSGHWDSLFGVWRLAWIADALASSDLELFDAPIFYPAARTLAFSDAVLVPALVAAPLRYAGVPPILVYNLMLFAGFVTSGVAMFVLSRSMTGRGDAALVAAVIYMAAPYRLDHLDHFEMQMAAWMPFALWLWHRAVDGGRPWLAGGAVGATVMQWLSCIYYGLLFAPVLGVVMAIEWTSIARSRRRPILLALAAAAAAGVVAIAVYSAPYLANRATTGDREAEAVAQYSATLWSYLAVPPHNALYAHRLAGFGEGEARLFPGVLALVLSAIGLATGSWNRRRWAYACAGLVAFDLSLGANGLVFPVLREWAVPYRGLRAPARAGVMVLLVISVLAGSGAAWLFARLKRRRAAAACTAVFLMLALIEYRNPPDRWGAPAPARMPELGLSRGSVVLDMPIARPDRLDQSVDADYMVHRIGDWPSLVNGYSGFHPRDYIMLADRARDFPDERSIREMARIGVDVLAVHERWYGTKYHDVVAALDARSDVEQIGVYYVGSTAVAVYQVMR